MRVVSSSLFLCAVLFVLPRFSSQATLGTRPPPDAGDDGEATVEVDMTKPSPQVPAKSESALEGVKPESPTVDVMKEGGLATDDSPNEGPADEGGLPVDELPNERESPSNDEPNERGLTADDLPNERESPANDELSKPVDDKSNEHVIVGGVLGDWEDNHHDHQHPAVHPIETDFPTHGYHLTEMEPNPQPSEPLLLLNHNHHTVHLDHGYQLTEMEPKPIPVENLHDHERRRRSLDDGQWRRGSYWHDIVGPNEELAKHNVGYRIKNYVRKRLENPGYLPLRDPRIYPGYGYGVRFPQDVNAFAHLPPRRPRLTNDWIDDHRDYPVYARPTFLHGYV